MAQRQQPGLACEECRRRKARCDRARPSCGSCSESNAVCYYNDQRPQRGPRKGQMNALKNLVANLEQRLSEQSNQSQIQSKSVSSTGTSQRPDPSASATSSLRQELDLGPAVPTSVSMDLNEANDASDGFVSSSVGNESLNNTSLGSTSHSRTSLSSAHLDGASLGNPNFVNTDVNMLVGFDESPFSAISDANYTNDWINGGTFGPPSVTTVDSCNAFSATHLSVFGNSPLSDLMQLDLDELYFDRVHPVAPNIHRQRYYSRANQKSLSPSQIALQYAMRAVAAAISTQFRHFSAVLCAESRRILEQIDADSIGAHDDTPIEQIQAWLLIAHYELLCKNEHQTMLTAGRAIRLVQVARLHDLDADSPSVGPMATKTPVLSILPEDDSFAKLEEKRRTFWLAYCFDRFCLMRSECPPSLQEESIRTRLPAPEANFQSNQPVCMDFLPRALASSGRNSLPSFAECIVLNTLVSRCTSQQRLARSASMSQDVDSREFWSKHTWLALIVEKRKHMLMRGLSTAPEGSDDPMMTFAHALAGCTAICLHQSMAQLAGWPSADDGMSPNAYEEQAVQAASDIAHAFQIMPRAASLKAHPFLPTPIYRAALFLVELSTPFDTGKSAYSKRDDDLNTLLTVLRGLQPLNNLSRELLSKLEQQISLTA